MLKTLSASLLSLIAIFAVPASTLAETVMEKVSKTGVLSVGVRTDIVPFSYVNDKQELTGYSVELLEVIRQQLEEDLGRSVRLDYDTSENFSERIQKVIDKKLDLVCDTVFTWERDKYVDFSLGYGVSGIKVLVKKDSNITNPEALRGKRIGFIGNLIKERSIDTLSANITPVSIATLEEGLQAVETGKIDGFAFDSAILEGMRQTLASPDAYAVIPKEAYYNHGIACMVPQGDSRFLHTVNYAIVKMMDGYLTGDARYTEMVNRYFGKDGIVPIDPDRIRNFFEVIVITREQIPPSTTSPQK